MHSRFALSEGLIYNYASERLIYAWLYIMSYTLDAVAARLHEARLAKGWSQRELGAQAGMPQAHISRIERGAVDMQVSSLIELARALDLELVLAPRSALPAVEAVTREAGSSMRANEAQRELAELAEDTRALAAENPDRADLQALHATAREVAALTRHARASGVFETVRRLDELLRPVRAVKTLLGPTEKVREVLRATEQLRELRNAIVHMPTDAPRPAYSLDEDD